jgi:hypothetical protein
VFVFRKYCHWTDSRSRDEKGAEPLSRRPHVVELQIGIVSLLRRLRMPISPSTLSGFPISVRALISIRF